MKFGISIVPNKPATEFVEHVKLAEEESFDSAWIADVGLHRETFMMCALACQGTRRIRIGTGVVNPYTRHPGLIAAQVATLQEMSHGRAFLGLGAGGYRALRQLGISTWDRPALTLRESIKVIRGLLEGEKLTFRGSVLAVANAQIDFQTQARPPIYLGVMLGRQGLRMAGELCDGALLVGPLGNQTKRIVETVKQAASDSGRDPQEIDIAMTAPFSVSRKPVEAIRAAKQTVAELGVLDDRLRPAILAEGITDEAISRVKDAVQQGRAAEEAVTDAMVDLFGIAGTPSDCVEKIALLRKIGINQIVVGRPARQSPEMMKIIGKDIIPILR